MKKIKFLNLINYILLSIIVIIDIILGVVFKGSIKFYYSSVLLLAASGIVNLVFMLIKEFAVLAYDSNKFYPIIFGGHVFIGVLLYYLVAYVEGYYEFWYLYWIGLVLGITIPIIIFLLINRKNKKNDNNTNKPRFMVNRR